MHDGRLPANPSRYHLVLVWALALCLVPGLVDAAAFTNPLSIQSAGLRFAGTPNGKPETYVVVSQNVSVVCEEDDRPAPNTSSRAYTEASMGSFPLVFALVSGGTVLYADLFTLDGWAIGGSAYYSGTPPTTVGSCATYTLTGTVGIVGGGNPGLASSAYPSSIQICMVESDCAESPEYGPDVPGSGSITVPPAEFPELGALGYWAEGCEPCGDLIALVGTVSTSLSVFSGFRPYPTFEPVSLIETPLFTIIPAIGPVPEPIQISVGYDFAGSPIDGAPITAIRLFVGLAILAAFLLALLRLFRGSD